MRRQTISLFAETGVSTTPELEALLLAGSPVAIGVSGGIDSCAAALATVAYLNSINHSGPRLLIHSDLGRVEWRDSLPTCERLAAHLGLELVIVRRQAGDLLDRWRTRWSNNVARYAALECVKLILPWSTPAMRFCTSELKTAIICRELVRRFPGQVIVSVAGIRRDESARRAKAPIVANQTLLTNRTHATTGYSWHPILSWSKADAFAATEAAGAPVHEAYTCYGSSRVSCAFCILASQADLRAASGCVDNAAIYRALTRLEVESTFSFQDDKWLADVAPALLDPDVRAALPVAKECAQHRQAAEARIPAHLLYTKGWPTCVPAHAEAELLCEVRRTVAAAVGLTVDYITPDALIARYEQLMAAKGEESRVAALLPQTLGEGVEQPLLLELEGNL